MPLWVGVWFPPRWAGNPSFVSEYLLVEEINYTAFESRQWYDDCRAQPGYTKVEIKDAGIKTIPFATVRNINKLNNGDFETMTKHTRDNTYYGWEVDTASKGTMALSTNKTTGSHSYELTASNDTSSKYHGQYLKQTLTNAFPGYEYDFKIDAALKTNDSAGNIEIVFRDDISQKVSEIIIPVTTTTFKTYSEHLVVPRGASQIEITLTAETNAVYYDNASLYFNYEV